MTIDTLSPTFASVTKPLSLSDDQLTAVLDAAAPLQPADRARFLADVAAALRGRELGDGVVGRVLREIQRRYLVPPDLSRSRNQSRWR